MNRVLLAAGGIAVVGGVATGFTLLRQDSTTCSTRVTFTNVVRGPDHSIGFFEVVNDGTGTCRLRAFPALSFAMEGRPVDATVTERATGRGAAELRPGQGGSFQLRWATTDSRGCTDQAVLDSISINVTGRGHAMRVDAAPSGTRGSKVLAMCGRTASVSDVVVDNGAG